MRTNLHLAASASCIALTSFLACAGQERVNRMDCGLSFVVPAGLEYIEVENPKLDRETACVIALKRPGAADPEPVGQPEGWREQVDFVLEVKKVSLEHLLSKNAFLLDGSG